MWFSLFLLLSREEKNDGWFEKILNFIVAHICSALHAVRERER